MAGDELNYRRVQFEKQRLQRRPVSATAGRLIIDDTMAHHTACSMEGLAYLRDHSLGHNVWAHDVVTSYYVNRSDQFPVDFRLYYQFNRKYEQQVLNEIGGKLAEEPSLANYRQYLASLVSYHPPATVPSKTVLAVDWSSKRSSGSCPSAWSCSTVGFCAGR
jgi:hypothetical protein